MLRNGPSDAFDSFRCLRSRAQSAVVPLDDAAEVAQLTVAKVGSERQRKAEIEKGVLVRPEIDETLRRLKIIE